MITKSFAFTILSLSCALMIIMLAEPVYSASPTSQANTASAQGAGIDISGTWTGTFFSNYPNVPSFSLTVKITPNGKAHFLGDSSLNSVCLKGATLQITVTGTQVVLAGSDAQGDNLTVRGTLDPTATMLQTASYVLNASASGQCETDDGNGSLTKF